MKNLLLFVAAAAFCSSGMAQENSGEKTFQLTGQPIVTIFANYHAGLGRNNSESGFALERSYLGYQFRVSKQLSGKVVFDIGSTNVSGSDLERVAYVKNAQLSYTTGRLALDFGLIGLEQFNVQEKFWGYRYILKSFQDEYKFGSSADMGVLARYRFTDWLSADFTLSNGEGYKKLNNDNKFRYGVGVTMKPVQGLTLRGYYDRADKNVEGPGIKAQQSLAVFAGYKNKLFSVGAEYNAQYDTKYREGHDQQGYSAYTTLGLGKNFQAFGRYDKLDSQDGWSAADGQRLLVGVQYTPIKQLHIAPNFTNWNPAVGKAISSVFLNVEFKL